MERTVAVASTTKETGDPFALKMVAPLEPAIICFDIERMLQFYQDILGLKLVGDVETPAEIAARLHISPHGYRIVRLQSPYGERIKLVQPKVHPKGRTAADYVYERPGYAYMSFLVANMDEVFSRLRAHKLTIVSDGIVETRKGVWALFTRDPEGNFVEFVRYADIAAYRPDLL